jgi:xanthine dehydrogenase accessory factor
MTSSAYQESRGGADAGTRARRVLVLGCGDVGSAVGHRLFGLGAHVVLCDLARPAHARRGTAYTDALFGGSATLDGVTARRVDDVAGVLACWSDGRSIPIAVMPEPALIEALRPEVLVEATMRRNRTPTDLRGLAPLTVGLGPGFAIGVNCHVAIETQWGERMGLVLREGATAPLAGGPKPLDGITRERFVTAPVAGTWHCEATIGARVRAMQVLGRLAGQPIRAPIDGVLRGITHDGVEVRAGQKIIEVDPRDPPQVFGLGERPAAIARGVAAAIGLGDES